MSAISVVVPTYNRGVALAPTLDRLLATDCQGLGEVEIVVVDDGSPVPAAPVVNARQAPPGIELKCIRQANSGPAAARNLGFTTSRGGIVIFIDDDILVPPDLIRQHVEAHALNPGAVIFGGCVPPPDVHSHVSRLLESLYGRGSDRPRFERVSIVASGQLSVEREFFPDEVYASELRTPAAEEFELSARLRQHGIPAIYATQIEAIHDQRLGISDVCDQQYKHGMGCAEAACTLPRTLTLEELAKIAAANGPMLPGDSLITRCKKRAKTLASIAPVRRTLVLLCGLTGRIVPIYRMNAKLLLFVIGVFFFAGYREGLQRCGRAKQ